MTKTLTNSQISCLLAEDAERRLTARGRAIRDFIAQGLGRTARQRLDLRIFSAKMGGRIGGDAVLHAAAALKLYGAFPIGLTV